jgi:hypothetical protein
LGITLGSGVVAGFAAAVLSHVNFDFFTFLLLHHADLSSLPIHCYRRSTRDMVLKVLWYRD